MVDFKFIRDFQRTYFLPMTGRSYKPNEIKLPVLRKDGTYKTTWTQATVNTTLAICGEAYKRGYVFYTEVYFFRGKRRADIVIPEYFDAQVIEIFDSESKESIDSKRKDYQAAHIAYMAVPADPQKALKKLGWDK